MIFWRYVKKLNKEVWLTLEQFDLTKIKSKINRNKCYVNNYKKERENALRWKRKNVEKNRENSLKWQKQNPQKACERSKRWHRNNPHVMRAISAKYRASRKNQTPSLSEDEKNIIKEIYKTRERISECTGLKFHIDHIIPISKGGLHSASNLQILPEKVNIRKSDKIL